MMQTTPHDTLPRDATRPYVLAVIASLVISALLIAGVSYLLSVMQRSQVTEVRLQNTATWTKHFLDHTPGIASLIVTGAPTAHQIHGIEMAESFDHVDGLALIDSGGAIVFQTDGFDSSLAGNVQQTIRAALDSGAPKVIEVGETVHDGLVETLLISVSPVFGPTGTTIGALLFLKHETHDRGASLSVSELLSLLMPIVSAVAFLIPMLFAIRFSVREQRKQQHIARITRFDTLTGALNRGSFMRDLEDVFADGRRNGVRIGLLRFDLDHFKSLNVQYGPHAADYVLQTIASRFAQQIGTASLLGRQCGDEFTVVLPHVNRQDLRHWAEELHAIAASPIHLRGEVITASVSVGMHLARPAERQEDAINRAGLALVQSKANGRDQVTEYVPAMDTTHARDKHIENLVRCALKDQLLSLAFQPIVDATSHHVAGFEALLRLNSPQGDCISPEDFIPLAERTGLIRDMGWWVLEEATRQAQDWDDHIYVSVNLSAVQLQSRTLAHDIIALLHATAFPPHRLVLELTESMLLTDEAGVSQQIEELRAAGIRVAMDDFGTGFSSLGYLWKYQFDAIKVDRSFLSGTLLEQEKDREIVETIVLLGHKLDMNVVVEGIETQRQVDILADIGADLFQGFYFARPLRAEDVAAWTDGWPAHANTQIRHAGLSP